MKMLYDGQPIALKPEAEEVATFFAQVLGTDYAKNATFCKNFIDDFSKVLKEHDRNAAAVIKQFDKCDFQPIRVYLDEQRDQRKIDNKLNKDKIKKEKAEIDAKYGWALMDGRKEKVGNFRIEPPGLFRGRGDHPLTGFLKTRVTPEQITINIDEDAEIP